MAKNGLTALQRKAGADRPPPDHGVMSPAKALRLALAQAGEDLLGSAILTGTVEEARTTVPQMGDLIEAGALVMLLQGRDRSRGLAILDAGALTAVIEALTTGRISAGEAPSPPRMPTATDAFLTGRFVTRIVGAFSEYLETLPGVAWAGAFSASEQVRDVRSLPLLLEDLAFRAISAPLDFDAGARQGTLRLVLPWGSSHPAPNALPAPSPAAEVTAGPPSQSAQSEEALRALLQGEVTLEAILHRQRLPLSGLLGWKPGDLLSFPAHAISKVALVDAAGARVATARLGQTSGQRALKLLRGEGMAEGPLSPSAMAAARATGLQAGHFDQTYPSNPKHETTPAAPDASVVKADQDTAGAPAATGTLPDLPKLPTVVD